MSTKTSIKRIAAVAAVALTLGGFSAVSAHATGTTAGDISVTAAVASTLTGGTTETATATAGANNYVGITVLQGASPFAAVVTGGVAVTASTSVTGSGTGSLVIAGSGTPGEIAFNIPTPTVGTITLKVYAFSGGVQSSTATSTLTITVSAAATGVGTINVGNSKSYITESSTVTGVPSAGATVAITQANGAAALALLTADEATVVSKGAAGNYTIVGAVVGVVKDSQVPTPAAMTGKLITATITGSGLLTGSGSVANGALAGTPARVATSTTGVTDAGAYVFGVYSDGTAGVGTITISYTDSSNVTTVLATKTVTFYGAQASFTATQKVKYIPNSGVEYPAGKSSTSGTYAVKLSVKDAAGNAVAGVTPLAKVAAADAITVSSATCTASSVTSGSSYCSVTGVSGAADGTVVVTFYTGSAATFNYVSTDVSFTVVNPKAASLTVTGDSSVSGGQVVTYTVTAKDAAGNPVPDGELVTNYIVVPTVAGGAMTDFSSVNANAANALFTGVKFLNGVATDSVQAPFGTTSLVATFDGTGLGVAPSAGSYYTTVALVNAETVVTTTVGNDAAAQAATDAAQEATDAANAAYDAANNAMDSADAATAAAQDASDNASAALAAVTSLSATVAKLVSSVTAIATALAAIKKKLGVK